MGKEQDESRGFFWRLRSNGVDLNRDFPSPLEAPDGPLVAMGNEQPETAAVMRWTSETPFVASASMHEVAAVLLLCVVQRLPFGTRVPMAACSATFVTPSAAS